MAEKQQVRAPLFHYTKLWAICEKHGNGNITSEAWAKLSREGKLSMETSARMIRAWEDKNLGAFQAAVTGVIPGFRLNPEAWDAASQPNPGPLPGTEKPEAPEAQPEAAPAPEPVPEVPKRKVYEVKTEGYIKPEIFDEVCQLVENKFQVCLIGPSGTGKSRMGREIFKALDMPLNGVFTLGGGLRFQHFFYTTEMKDGETRTRLLPFLEALGKPGGVIIDEIWAGDEDILVGLNPITEKSQRYFQTPIGPVYVHPDCVIMATANTTGRSTSDIYTGTKRQDNSVVNRFIEVEMGYSAQVEKALLASLPRMAQDFLIQRLGDLRTKARGAEISQDFSTRGLIQARDLIEIGILRERAFYLAFITPLSLSERLAMGLEAEAI